MNLSLGEDLGQAYRLFCFRKLFLPYVVISEGELGFSFTELSYL